MTSSQKTNKFYIITTLGDHNLINKGSITKAIEYHLTNQYVTEIHILTNISSETILAELPLANHNKIHLIRWDTRPSFHNLLEYSNDLANAHYVTVALMKIDVSFENQTDIEKCTRVIEAARLRGHTAALSLSCRDKKNDLYEILPENEGELALSSAIDCLVFRPPLVLPDGNCFSLNKMDCDPMSVIDWSESGITLINPCIDISILHHSYDVRHDNSYLTMNNNQQTKQEVSRHSEDVFDILFRSCVIASNCEEWVRQGYIPKPIKRREVKRIFLLLSSIPASEHILDIIFTIEIFAKYQNADLFILGDNIHETPSNFVRKIGQISRRAYFVRTESIDSILTRSISTGFNYSSVALIRNIKYLNSRLLDEFQCTILDLRHNNADIDIDTSTESHSLALIDECKYQEKSNPQLHSPDRFTVTDSCTLITSIFKADQFIEGFRNNIVALDGYDTLVHIMLFSTLSDHEREIILGWHTSHTNLILGWFKSDPGLYECWNIGIRLAPTEYISNANVDDLRRSDHVQALMECLRSRPETMVAASAIVPFTQYTGNILDIDASHPWYTNQAGKFDMDSLARIEKGKNGNWTLVPNNLPHCMPVWRKSLHEKYGYFDEKRFGTFADWAFWLKVTKGGEKGYLDARPLSFYYINPTSHNRRGDKLNEFHLEVEHEYLEAFYFRMMEGASPTRRTDSPSSLLNCTQRDRPRKLHLTGWSQFFGKHRNSFHRLIASLLPLHRDEGGVEFIPFIERYFSWGTDDGEAASPDPRPIERDWVGILHVPFDAPRWFNYETSPETIFHSRLWKSSLPFCRGLICLSEDLSLDLSRWYPHIPILAVKHPTVLDVKPFDWKAYERRPRLIQVGDWLRRLQAIYQVRAPGHEKIMLMKRHTSPFLEREMETIGNFMDDSVTVLEMASDKEYDELLRSSVVLCILYASAANNTVLECIARRTPILINPLPSVVEYLGADYPLYVTQMDDASSAISDMGRVRAAHEYLESEVELRQSLSYDCFFKSIAESDFYADLPHCNNTHP